MTNGPIQGGFWKEFILTRCEYPAPDRLRAQLANAEMLEFCECGCNSFAVKVKSGVHPLAPPNGQYGAIFTADFVLTGEQTLEIVLFADEDGNLAYVEIDFCANSYPVPEVIEVTEKPAETWSSDQLLS